jgi:hypothetical protein
MGPARPGRAHPYRRAAEEDGVSPFFAIFLVLLLGSSSYAAGRLHGQLSYRLGYRYGYRQGFLDGERGAWNRRRRDSQLALASAGTPSALPTPALAGAGATTRQGTTYTGATFTGTTSRGGRHSTELLASRKV